MYLKVEWVDAPKFRTEQLIVPIGVEIGFEIDALLLPHKNKKTKKCI